MGKKNEKRLPIEITKGEAEEMKRASELQSLLLERLLSVRRAAELAGVSEATIRRAIHEGKLRALDIGRGEVSVYRIPYFWYLQYIARKLPGGLTDYLNAYEEFEGEEAVEGLEKMIRKYQNLLRVDSKGGEKE